ncbi:MAG: carboxypeptidase-like regulatory domain-containing protein [Methanomassiliicoccus sp.]|nr:carboxypeptidase-like regulatory domain-containing protein [Methanomassiliicoccus sp.]
MNGLRSKIKIASILIVAFVIMIAALMYYPYRKDSVAHDNNNPIVLTVHGLVTDENGTPLENASVIVTGPGVITKMTNASGFYSITFNAVLELNISAMASGHWVEYATIYPNDQKTDIFANFTLWKSTIISVPLGIATFIDSPDGSSRFTLNINVTNSCYIIKQAGSDESIPMYLSAGNLTCNTSVGSGPTILYMNVSIFGSYWMTNKTIRGFGCEAIGPAYGVPLNMVNPDTTTSSWNHTTFDLKYGERGNVTLAAKNDSYSFPTNFAPTFTVDALGKNITFHEIGVQTFDYIIEREQLVNVSGVVASMDVTPLTSGNHAYDVYVEDGCMICLREVASNHS